MTARRQIDPAALLVRAVAQYARGQSHAFRLGEISARPWASATFEGERVEIELNGVEPGAVWLADLPDAELKVRRHYVADLVVHAIGPSAVRIEALLLLDL